MTRPALPVPRLSWAYFFDIDGTLVDIGPVPDQIRVGADMRSVIDRLYDATGGAVALVSGRAIRDIDTLYPRCRFPVAGQHGVEWRDAAGVLDAPTAADGLDDARRTLASVTQRYPSLRLEDKGHSLAVHYRQTPRLGAHAHRVMRALQAASNGMLEVQRGKAVVELKPAGTHKGVAVRRFMQCEPFAGRTPVFVGDDITDEYGFAAVNALYGHSIKVGRGKTVAQWRLRDIPTLMTWLQTVQ
ncbi:trehalose-phosphatase [soil metagenome]